MKRALQAAQAAIAQAARDCGRDPNHITLLAVSKTHSVDAIRAAYAAGQREFGENRVQELSIKARQLAELKDLRWHMIGSLQTNKVEELLAVPGLVLVHSLDRQRLADALQQQAARLGVQLPVLLQLHATGEASKHGCPMVGASALLEYVLARCPNLELQGVMAMGPLAGDPAAVFAAVHQELQTLRAQHGLPLPILSLGMSGDLQAAIAAGSTMVRLGSAIFGERG